MSFVGNIARTPIFPLNVGVLSRFPAKLIDDEDHIDCQLERSYGLSTDAVKHEQ
jgi:hypothetical protein